MSTCPIRPSLRWSVAYNHRVYPVSSRTTQGTLGVKVTGNLGTLKQRQSHKAREWQIDTINYIHHTSNHLAIKSTTTTLSKTSSSTHSTDLILTRKQSCHIFTSPIYRQNASSIVKARSTISFFVRFVGVHLHLGDSTGVGKTQQICISPKPPIFASMKKWTWRRK